MKVVAWILDRRFIRKELCAVEAYDVEWYWLLPSELLLVAVQLCALRFFGLRVSFKGGDDPQTVVFRAHSRRAKVIVDEILKEKFLRDL